MPRNDGYRRYLEAAAVLGEITRARAEELVRELMGSGDVQRAQAQQWVDELVGRSRKAAEDLLQLVRTEVSSQMQALGLDPEELARQAAEILRRSAEAGRRKVKDAARAGRAPKKGATAKSEASKAPPKKGATAKSEASKAPAKKGATAKSEASKAPAKKGATAKSEAKRATTKARAAKVPAPGAQTPARPPSSAR
jgi:polyhydroxyalkanoate synthesis regulator phasin